MSVWNFIRSWFEPVREVPPDVMRCNAVERARALERATRARVAETVVAPVKIETVKPKAKKAPAKKTKAPKKKPVVKKKK